MTIIAKVLRKPQECPHFTLLCEFNSLCGNQSEKVPAMSFKLPPYEMLRSISD